MSSTLTSLTGLKMFLTSSWNFAMNFLAPIPESECPLNWPYTLIQGEQSARILSWLIARMVAAADGVTTVGASMVRL
eukprot:1049992-Prorocentrum_minimum.AAC.1